MVSARPDSASWWIVPYEGDTPFKRVRIRDEARVQSVLRHILAHQCVALVGPANCEKSHLLSDVVGELHRSGRFLPVIADLWAAASTDETAFFNSLADLIIRRLPNPPPAPGPINTARAFQNFLVACCARHEHHIALFVDHLQALPHDLVHALLLSLRAAYMEQPVDALARLVAIVTGGMNLVGFSAAPTSPFNIARPVLAGPLTAEQTVALARASFEAWGCRASAGAVERLAQWAGGDHYLIPWLCHQSAQVLPGRPTRFVTRRQLDQIIAGLVDRPTRLLPFNEAIKMIEEDPDTLLDMLDVLSNGQLSRRQSRQVITRTGLDRLQLSGGLVLANGYYCIKNEAFRQALSQHFSTERVAHVLRIAGRWQEAIDYLGPRLALGVDQSARPQLLEAIVQSIYAADSSEEAFELLAQGLRLGFRSPELRIYRANLPNKLLDRVVPVVSEQDPPDQVSLFDPASVEAQTFLYRTYALRGSGAEARLVASLSTPHRPIGIVAIEHFQREQIKHATPDELPDLLRFLLHAAGALENVLDRVAYRQIGQAVLDANATSPALERVLEAVAGALGCDFAALYLLDEAREMLDLTAAIGFDLEQTPSSVRRMRCEDLHPLAVTLAAQGPQTVRQSQDKLQPVLVRTPDDRMIDLFPGDSAAHHPLLIHLPLYASGTGLGVLALGYSGRFPAPGESGMPRLTGLADQVAIAVHNVGLLRRTEEARARRVAELEKLRLSSMAVSSTLTLEESLGRIIAGIQDLFTGAETTIWEYLPERQESVALQSTSRQTAGTIAASVRQAPFANPASSPRTRRVPTGPGCIVSTALISHDQPIGLMEVYLPRTQEEPLRPNETALLEAFAAQAAVSIENARFREREAARQRVERELALAREIQLSLLPGAFPDLPGWDFATIYRAARVVGGDFYDHFVLAGKPSRLGLIIADVADKGVPAALFMALSRTIIRTTALSGRGPASALLRANELILKDSASDLFLTAAYALLELEKGRMIYANAGHTRPLLYRSANRQVLQLAGRGTVLGAFENIRLEERRVDLAPGDVLMFYTDGVIETQDSNGAFFEESRLYDVLRRSATAPAGEIAAALDEAVLAFQGSADQFDDVACVVVKRA